MGFGDSRATKFMAGAGFAETEGASSFRVTIAVSTWQIHSTCWVCAPENRTGSTW